jgi:hypothetical protein
VDAEAATSVVGLDADLGHEAVDPARPHHRASVENHNDSRRSNPANFIASFMQV